MFYYLLRGNTKDFSGHYKYTHTHTHTHTHIYIYIYVCIYITKDTYIYIYKKLNLKLSVSVQLLSYVQIFAISWPAACQASLSITNSWSLLKLMSIKSVMPSSHLILCHPLLLLPSIIPSISVFSNESVVCIRWPKYWSFSFSIHSSNK